MITSKAFPGGGYGDCLPDGRYAVWIVGSHVDTSSGRVDFFTPANEPLFLRIADDGHAFAGKSWNAFDSIEYVFGVGWALKPEACGNNSVIYDQANALHISDCSMGTQGWRYVAEDGTLVSGDSTYGPTPQAPRLFEWTDLTRDGDTLVVGQGDSGGCVFWDGSEHRVLEPGDCTFIRARRWGAQVSVFMVRLNQPSLMVLLDRADVDMLPVYPDVPPPQPDKPIGPLGPPLPWGTVYDLSPFFQVDDRCWPRGDKARGDTHGMDMQSVADPTNTSYTGTTWWHAKFDKDGQGKLGELLSMDAPGTPDRRIHLRCDASAALHPTNPYVDTWTDSTWLLATMAIGQIITIKCERVWYHPITGVELGRENYTKEMQLLNVWEKYWGGADVGQGRCIEYRYNVERYREFIADDGRVWGWGDWDYNNGADFFYSRFWLKGGQRFPVRLPNCPMPIAILPQEPPVPDFPMPPHVLDTIRAFAGVFPLPQGGDDVAMHAWSRKCAEQVKFSHDAPGIEYGLKSTSAGSPVSNNLARKDAGLDGLHIWDYIAGSAGSTPSIKHDGGEYFFAQHVFHPVVPTNHLALLPPANFPPLALPFWGATAFDLAAAVTNGEVGYYNLLNAKKLKPRVQVYATINHPATGRWFRDFPLGLEQMKVLLPKMKADGMKGQFVYLVGTGEDADNVSRADAIERIKQIDALVCSFPETIAGRQGGNELYYPGLEASYMSDDAFWDEVETLINPNFPWTRGAGHGGGGVNMSGGSYLVHHSDRALGPDAAGAILADAKNLAKRNIIDDEGKRIEKNGDGGQSTGDINFVIGQIANAKKYEYGLTVHVAFGRGCRLAMADDVQLQAIDLVSAEVVDPMPQHPVLDVDFRRYVQGVYSWTAISDEGYILYVNNGPALDAEIVAWCKRGTGVAPAKSDIDQIHLRLLVERDRFPTPRVAMTNKWPTGAP